jgi:hypothetical protein
MSRRSVKWFGIFGVIASVIGVAVSVLPSNHSAALAQSIPRNSAVTTGDQSPAIGSNNGNVYNNYYNTGVKEKPADPRSHLLIGTWKGVQRHVLPNGQLLFTGYTRLFESGKYSSTAELSFQSTKNGRRVETIIPFLASGTWELNGNKYVSTLTAIKPQYNVLWKEEGQPDINMNTLLVPPDLRPKLEDVIPLGSSQEFEIVELTPTTWKAWGKDLKGIEFVYEGVRQ